MNTKKYLQTDSAWSGLGCPAYPCYIGRDGCGLVSIANILIEMEQYAQYTPATIQPYCKQFMASDCEGTIWSGVPVMLKHYGLTDVMEHQNFSTLWPELAKGNRVVFYIMGSNPGGSKRVKWSSGGHCVCSVDYKYEDGLHKVYMKDSYSNSELRNKWISYEENIRGACLAIWSGKLVGTPTPPPTPPKPGQLVVDGIGGTETVMAMQQAFGVGIDGIISGQATKWSNYYPSITAISFGGGGSQTIWKLQEWLNLSDPDGILGPNTTKAWQKRLRDYGYLASTETIDGIIGAKTMKAWQECLNNGLKPKSQPTPPTPSGGEHYPGPYPVVKYYLEPGDKGENVTRLQNYLNWYTDGQFFKECGGADGIYGNNTLKYVKKMQTDFFGASEADGKVGNKTINKMQAYEKPVQPQPVPPTPPTPTTNTKVIDVSYVQTSINWDKVKASGIEGAMVRCGFRGYESAKLKEDDMFLSHIKGASAVGLKVGVYFFTEAINEAEGREEAEFTLKLIEKAGVDLYYPIAVDTEYIGKDKDGVIPRADNISKTARTNAIKGFCDVIKERGGQPMIYASLNWFDTHLNMSKLPFDVWVAQYYSKCEYEGKYLMWQYTSKGSVDGVKGVVDMNECYITSPAPKPTPSPTPTPSKMPTDIFGDFAESPAKMGQACGSETGGYSGKAGDQTGRELLICNYEWESSGAYNWHSVFRAKSNDARIVIADACRKACNNDHIGYDTSEPDRKTLYIEAKKVNWQIDKITTDCETTCSELANVCIACAGLNHLSVNENAYVATLDNFLCRSSEFTKVALDGKTLQPGDILVSDEHVAIIVGSIIRKGEASKRVYDLQMYLDWYTDGAFFKECGSPDYYYGDNTYKYVVAMQTDFFGASEADGTIAQKTLEKMKAVKK